MTFRKQTRYNVENPEELQRQLVQLENSIEQALIDLKAETYPRGKVYEVRSGETINALIGGYYKCDTSGGSITLLLEKPKAQHGNTFIVVEKTSGSNSVTLRPVDSLINGTTSAALTAANAYDVYCNGVGYRREF